MEFVLYPDHRFMTLLEKLNGEYTRMCACVSICVLVFFHRDAWKALGNVSKEEAMMHYVLLVNKLDPSWKNETSLQSTTAESDEDPRIEASTVI